MGAAQESGRSNNTSNANKEPPGSFGLPLVGETLDFLADPVKFTKDRMEKYGPVYKTHIFGKPTLMVGESVPVQEFMDVEHRTITESSLPATFVNLHTEYGALNQQGERLRSTRANLSKVLGAEAIKSYLPTMDAYTHAFLDKIVQRGYLTLTPDLEELCIQMYAKMFTGVALPAEIQADFRTYNDGLVALAPVDLPFTAYGKGKAALARLQAFMEAHIERITADGTLATDPAYFAIWELSQCVDETGARWTTERVGTALTLLIWGAFSEAASLVANILYVLPSESAAIQTAMRAEVARLVPDTSTPIDFATTTKMQYLEAVCNESLRINPPAGGGMRVAVEEWQMSPAAGGYTVPSGWVISADPRIANFSSDVFPQPAEFVPERFASKGCPFGFGNSSEAEEGSSRADAKLAVDYSVRDEDGQLPKGAWIPGGIGSHQCPGIPLAMASSKVILARFLQRVDTWAPLEDREPVWKVLPIRSIDDTYTVALKPFESRLLSLDHM